MSTNICQTCDSDGFTTHTYDKENVNYSIAPVNLKVANVVHFQHLNKLLERRKWNCISHFKDLHCDCYIKVELIES